MSEGRRLMSEGRCLPQEQIDKMLDQELAVWYNDNVIYPDKVRLCNETGTCPGVRLATVGEQAM